MDRLVNLRHYILLGLAALTLSFSLYTGISPDPQWTADSFAQSINGLDIIEYEKKNDFSHTVKNHIGKNEAWLVARLQSDRRFKTASSYPDIETARYAISTVLSSNAPKIIDWLNNPEAPNKKSFSHSFDKEVGYGIRRNNMEKKISLKKATVVLIKLKGNKYGILTSYPI